MPAPPIDYAELRGLNYAPDLDDFNNLQVMQAGLDPHRFGNLRLLNPRFPADGSSSAK